MSKKFIAILTITIVFMIIGYKNTYEKIDFEEVNIEENIDDASTQGDINLAVNNSDIEDDETCYYENIRKYNLDIDPELREVILDYHKTDSMLGKSFEEPQIISYWKIDDTQFRITTSGYYSFGFGVWEPIDYIFLVEKNSNGDFVIKSWYGDVFKSQASNGMILQNFFDMEKGFKKDDNYSDIYDVLSKNARKYYTGVSKMYIIHYKKMSDTEYEVGIIDKMDYGVSTPIWESRIFLVQKNDSGQWNEVAMKGTILSDWNKFIYSNYSRRYVAKSLFEQGKHMNNFNLESFNRVSDNKTTAIVSFNEVISNNTNGTSELKKMAEVHLEQNVDGKWIALSMKELD